MNKQEYLNKLLDLCTDPQKNLFNRMYPEGVSPDRVKLATTQIENTLKNLNESKSKLSQFKKESEENANRLIEEKNKLTRELKSTELDLEESIELVARLRNPINIENNEVQEKLNLLAALEAGGVDNWEWYDTSISNYRNNQ